MFGAEPFSSKLRLSNLKLFRYDWIWQKTIAPNFMFQKKQPRRLHEVISVFYKHQPIYNPQMEDGACYKMKRTRKPKEGTIATILGQINDKPYNSVNNGTRYPKDVICFSNSNGKNIHPTQKPVDLIRYLIRTYTNSGG